MENAAWKFEYTVLCRADRSQAWSFLTNVTNWERLEGASVNWIRIYGPFAAGTYGETKMPDQIPQRWLIAEVEEGRSMMIETPVDGATLYVQTVLESPTPNETRIVRKMYLRGPKAATLAPGMKLFEENVPQGLRKLAAAIEAERG